MATRRTTTRRTTTSSSPTTDHDLIFGSIDELANTLQSCTASERILNNKDFSGFSFKDVNEVIKTLENGSPDILEEYNKTLTAAHNNPLLIAETPGNIYSYQQEGLILDIPTFLEGSPECYLQPNDEKVRGAAKKIIVNICASGGMNKEKFFIKLSKIVRLIDETEASGQRLEIVASFEGKRSISGNRDQPNVKFEVTIKKDKDPLHIQQIVTLLASSFLLRIVFFIVNSQYWPNSYGAYRQDEDKESNNMDQTDSIYIPSFYYDDRNNINNADQINTSLQTTYPHLVKQIEN